LYFSGALITLEGEIGLTQA